MSGTRPSDRAGSQEIWVTALEVEGDRCEKTSMPLVILN